MSEHEASDEGRFGERFRVAYRETPPAGPRARERLAEALSHAPSPRRRSPLAAWFAPRSVTVRPIAALAAACALVVAGVLLAPRLRPSAPPSAPAAAVPGAQSVRFVLVEPGAARVALVGDFNDWDATATPMHHDRGGGTWEVTVPLRPGLVSYAFVVDGHRWIEDPRAPLAPSDEYGVSRSVMVVDEL